MPHKYFRNYKRQSINKKSLSKCCVGPTGPAGGGRVGEPGPTGLPVSKDQQEIQVQQVIHLLEIPDRRVLSMILFSSGHILIVIGNLEMNLLMLAPKAIHIGTAMEIMVIVIHRPTNLI